MEPAAQGVRCDCLACLLAHLTEAAAAADATAACKLHAICICEYHANYQSMIYVCAQYSVCVCLYANTEAEVAAEVLGN